MTVVDCEVHIDHSENIELERKSTNEELKTIGRI
jgi:hypothetical protein